jgi:hypothetical protein
VLGFLGGVSGLVAGGGGVVSALAAPPALVELDDHDYQAVYAAADWFDHLAVLPPPDGSVGLYLVFGDRFGLVRIYHLTHGASRDVWKSKQLDGVVEEVLVSDLDRDGGDEIIARTTGGMVYVWNGGDLRPRYESLKTDFTRLHSLTIGNVDDDPALELIVNADSRIHYIDGRTFIREWTSLNEFEATRMACGDVDGDRKNEIVLNTGQVLDARTGEVEWADEVFGSRLVLLDIDGDGILEVLTESDGAALRIYDVDLRKEKHLQ